MQHIRKSVERVAVRAALCAKTPAGRKNAVMELRRIGIISPSMAQWVLAVHGLRGA